MFLAVISVQIPIKQMTVKTHSIPNGKNRKPQHLNLEKDLLIFITKKPPIQEIIVDGKLLYIPVKKNYMSSRGSALLRFNSVSSHLGNTAGAYLESRRLLEILGSGTGCCILGRGSFGTLLASPGACHHSSVPCLLTLGIIQGEKQS